MEHNNNVNLRAERQDKYNILWLDDRYDEQKDFFNNAKKIGINLKGFRNLDDGFEELESNLNLYDAILLDTTFFIDKDDEIENKASSSVKALSRAVGLINKLSSKKTFPYFIFTSTKEYEKDPIFISTYERFYRKYVPTDMAALLNDMKKAVNSEIDAIIRNKYTAVFEVFTERYIGTAHQEWLFEILKNHDKQESLIQAGLYFNPLRKILEAILYTLYEHGMLPRECFKNEGEPNIMWCILYLSGKEIRMGRTRYLKPRYQVLPNVIKNNIWDIVSYTNIASHNEVVSKNVRNDISELKNAGVDTPYLLYSLTFQMLDIILWVKAHIDNNNLRRIR